ncbi:hypothetical protein HanIR_Chr09g0398901 [Helianthus annuus]|nr:hypothetical protein HanIR_Chr09g0398901 [Helianthus annuus]
MGEASAAGGCVGRWRAHVKEGSGQQALFLVCLAAVIGGIMVFRSAVVVVDVMVKKTGVTGDKHLLCGAASGD